MIHALTVATPWTLSLAALLAAALPFRRRRYSLARLPKSPPGDRDKLSGWRIRELVAIDLVLVVSWVVIAEVVLWLSLYSRVSPPPSDGSLWLDLCYAYEALVGCYLLPLTVALWWTVFVVAVGVKVSAHHYGRRLGLF